MEVLKAAVKSAFSCMLHDKRMTFDEVEYIEFYLDALSDNEYIGLVVALSSAYKVIEEEVLEHVE